MDFNFDSILNSNNRQILEYQFDMDDKKANLNYWANCPVKVIDTDSDSFNNMEKPIQILPNNIIIKKMENIITTHPYKLEYKINDKNLDSDKICDFINKNYTGETETELENKFKFLYKSDVIKYYITDSLVISFYAPIKDSKTKKKSNKSKMIGIIIGKKSKLSIQDILFDTVEVNFLTLNPKVRNNNLAPLMISILTKEVIINYSTGLAHYTINNPIKAPHYCLKHYYHRMINIENLLDTEFISDSNSSIDEYKIIYNNFKDFLPNQKIIYLNKKNLDKNNITIPNDLLDFIHKNVNSYSQYKYKIYEYKTREQISQIFNSESFHHFIFVDSNSNGEIKNYICLNELQTINIKNNKYYTNGDIYMGFYTDSLDILIEKLSEYVYTNKIVDVISWLDLFDVNNSCTLAIKGSGFLKYYLFNIQTSSIPNELNGLITL